DAVAGNRRPIRLDLELREARDLLHLDVLSAPDAADDAADFFGLAPEYVEVIAEDFDGHIRAHAGDEFGDPKLYRLREAESAVGDPLFKCRGHLRNQPFPVPGVRPLRRRFEFHEYVTHLDAHRIGGHVSAPGF